LALRVELLLEEAAEGLRLTATLQLLPYLAEKTVEEGLELLRELLALLTKEVLRYLRLKEEPAPEVRFLKR